MKNVKLWLAIICLIILMSFYMAGILTLDNIKTNEAYLRVFIEDHYGLSVLLFFVACTLFINSPIPLAAPLKVLGGFFSDSIGGRFTTSEQPFWPAWSASESAVTHSRIYLKNVITINCKRLRVKLRQTDFIISCRCG